MASYTPPIDEKKLVADLQNEKTAAQAFDTLMRTFGEPMYWQIRRMVVNHDDANDLLQNALIKAWNNIGNFRGDAKLSTWLYKIATNEAINFINRERQRNTMNVNEIQLALQKVIAKLPDKQRLVFNMRYFDEMKYEQISEILGTSVGALKASYHHAVKKIEKELSDLNP